MKNEVAEHGTSPVLINGRDPFLWGGPSYPTYAGFLEDPAGQGAAAGSPPAPPAGSPPASATAGSLDWATAPKQFREAYDKLKTETEPWTKLGKKPEEVTTGLQQADRYGKLHGDFIGVAEKLGYSEEEFEDAMEKNPGATVRFLLKKAAEQGTGRQPAARRDPNATAPEDRLKELVREEMKPLNEFHNQQMVQAAEVRFEQEFDRLHAEAYPKGLPEEMNLFLENVVSTLMGNDDKAMLSLKREGKVASIAKYYQQGREMVEKAFTAWMTHNTKSEGGPGKPPGGGDKPGGFDRTLKIGDLVEDISKLNPKYA